MVLRDPTNLEARGAMQLGRTSRARPSKTPCSAPAHAAANPLTAHYGITHGVAIGILLPHVIRFNAAAVGRALQ